MDARQSSRASVSSGVFRIWHYGDQAVYFPHWLVALVFALLAFALKPKPRLKFSLADLLVLIAGVAGLSRLAS